MSNKYRRPPKYNRPRVPRATVFLYIGIAVLILGVCALVFFLNLNKEGKSDGKENSPSSDPILPGTSSSQTSSSSAESSSSSDESSFDGMESSSASSSEISSTSSTTSSTTSSSSSTTSSSSGSEHAPVIVGVDFEQYFSEDLFIGDSILSGLSTFKYLDKNNVAAKVGYTPYYAMHSKYDDKSEYASALDHADKMKPRRIYIMLGANALGSGVDPLKNSYSTLLTELKSVCPKSTICCISITPRREASDYPSFKNEYVVEMNKFLEEQCKALGLDYYDFYSVVADSNGYLKNMYSEKDGLHYVGTTYKVLMSGLYAKYENVGLYQQGQ